MAQSCHIEVKKGILTFSVLEEEISRARKRSLQSPNTGYSNHTSGDSIWKELKLVVSVKKETTRWSTANNKCVFAKRRGHRKLFWRHHEHPLVVPKDTSIKEMNSFNRIAEDMLLEDEVGVGRNSDSENEMEWRAIKWNSEVIQQGRKYVGMKYSS